VAENPLHRDRLAPLAVLSGLGLIGLVDPLDGLLQQPANEGVADLNTAVRTNSSNSATAVPCTACPW